MDYKLIISREDFVDKLQKRGYNLLDASVLDQSHFNDPSDAVDDFLQNVFDIIQDQVVFNRGATFSKLFFEDMQKTDLPEDAQEYKVILIDALVLQAIYTYDNGDNEATSDPTREKRLALSEKAINKLWNKGILRG